MRRRGCSGFDLRLVAYRPRCWDAHAGFVHLVSSETLEALRSGLLDVAACVNCGADVTAESQVTAEALGWAS